jgi:hypothetical protein
MLPITCRGGGEGPDGGHDRVGWGRKGYGVCPPVTCRGGGEGPDEGHDRVGWGRMPDWPLAPGHSQPPASPPPTQIYAA